MSFTSPLYLHGKCRGQNATSHLTPHQLYIIVATGKWESELFGVCRALVNDYLPSPSTTFPIRIDGVRVRARRVDPPPGCGALAASPLSASNPYSTGRERARERGSEWVRERAGPGRRATKEKAERKTEQRNKWHSWQGSCSRPPFLFLGFLRLFRRRGYTPQMKVRLLGENNCRGLHFTPSPCVCAAEPHFVAPSCECVEPRRV